MCLSLGSCLILPELQRSRHGCVDKLQHSRLACQNDVMEPRFLSLADVQKILNVSSPQAYALVRSGELPAIQVGGRGIWRVEATELESYIQRQYAATRSKHSLPD